VLAKLTRKGRKLMKLHRRVRAKVAIRTERAGQTSITIHRLTVKAKKGKSN
jgi:hypothetical protein